MATTRKALIQAKQMEAAQTTQYTAPSEAKTVIDKFTATNTSGADAYINIHIVAFGNTPVDSNKIVDNYQIGSEETYELPELIGHILEPNSFISTSGTGSALTIMASGREIS